MKKFAIVFGILFAAALVCLAALTVSLRILYPKERILRIASAQASGALGADLAIEDAGIMLIPSAGFRLEGVSLAGVVEDAEPLMQLDELRVEVRLMPLLSRRVEVEKILLDRLRLHVEMDENGELNLPEFGAAGEEAPENGSAAADASIPGQNDDGSSLPVSFVMDEFELRNAGFRFVDKSSGLDFVIGRINQVLSLSVDAENTRTTAEGSLEASEVSVGGLAEPLSLSGMNLFMSHDIVIDPEEGRITISDFRGGFRGLVLSVKGKIEHFDEPAPLVDLELKAEAPDLASILGPDGPAGSGFLPEGVAVSGRVDAKIKIEGRFNPDDPGVLPVNGKVDLSGIDITHPALLEPVSCRGSISVSNRSIDADPISVEAGKSAVSITCTVADYLGLVLSGEGEPPPAVVKLDVKSPLLDLDELLDLEILLAPGEDGDAEPDPEEEEEFDTSRPIELPELPPVVFRGKIGFDEVRFFTVPVTGVAAKLDYEDKVASADLKASVYSGSFSERFAVNLDAPAGIEFSSGFRADNVEGNDFISNFNNLLTGDGALHKAVRELDDRIFGKLDMAVDLGSRGRSVDELKKNLTGEFTAGVSDGSVKNSEILADITRGLPQIAAAYVPDMKNVVFNEFTAKCRIKDETVIIDNLAIKTGGADYTAGGGVGFDGALDATADIRLSRSDSRNLAAVSEKGKKAVSDGIGSVAGSGSLIDRLAGAVLKDMETIPLDGAGRATLKIKIGGTLDHPSCGFAGFKGKPGRGSSAKEKEKRRLEKQVNEEIDKKKKEFEDRADKTRKDMEDKAKKELDKLRGKFGF